MKKTFFAVFASLLCICISCNDRPTVPGEGNDKLQAQKNLNAWHTVAMAFATGNQQAIDTVIADDYLDHTSRGDYRGKDSVKANIARWHTNMKDKKMEIIKELADNDYGFFWMRWTGTRKGAGGMPAEPFDVTSLQVAKFKDGKAIEHWEFMETKEAMKVVKRMQKRGLDKMDSSKVQK